MYGYIGIPLKLLTLDYVATLTTGWNKAEEGRWGAERAITTHIPSFNPGRYFTYPLDWVFDAVLNSSTDDMQNLAPPLT